MYRERCFLTLSFAIPTAVVLLQCKGLDDCGWPSSDKVRCIICPSFTLMNRVPSSALAANAAANLWMVHSTKIAPLSLIGSPSQGIDPMKK